MKSKRFAYVLILWWLLISAGLGCLLLCAAPREPRPSRAENRMLAGFPRPTREALASGAFGTDTERFLSDAFFCRDAVTEAAGRMLGAFDLRSEEQRQAAELEETDRLLAEDAEGGFEGDPDEAPWEEGEPWEDGGSFGLSGCLRTLLEAWIPSAAAEEPARLVLRTQGEEDKVVYNYPEENIRAFARTLDRLRGMLKEDGEVHYLQVPVAAVGRRLQVPRKVPVTWESTMERALQEMVGEGVTIHNAPAMLAEPLSHQERCFFFTDHHWTELGAWICAAGIARSRGYPVIPYDEYEYSSRKIGQEGRYEDIIRLLTPLLPVHSYVLTHLTEQKEIEFMNLKVRTYTAYINNTRTPWRRFVSGFGSTRRALLISDSFGNAFLPYLLPYYGEVHMTDLRANYYDAEEAGGTFRELLRYHDIDDVYIVFSTSNGINSKNSQEVFPAKIEEQEGPR